MSRITAGRSVPTRVQLTPLGERVFGPSEGVSEEGEIVSCFLSALSFRVSFLLRPPSLEQCSINTVKLRQYVVYTHGP